MKQQGLPYNDRKHLRFYFLVRFCFLALAWLFCLQLEAQTEDVRLSGHIAAAEGADRIFVENFDKVKFAIPLDAQHNFLFKGTLPRGFYEIDSIGAVYLRPGFSMEIRPAGSRNTDGSGVAHGTYIFSGKGAWENNALRLARSSPLIRINRYGDLKPATLALEPSDFLRNLDSFQMAGERLFSQSADTFFSRYAALDLKFFERMLCQPYLLHFYETADGGPGGTRDSGNMMRFVIKSMGRMKDLNARMYTNAWDENDEILFRNSAAYRQTFETWFAFRCVFRVSLAMSKKGGQASPGDYLLQQDIALLKTAEAEVSNPYILSYFDYYYTRTLLTDTRDTAVLGKYYREFMARSRRSDYQAAIGEVYQNAITYMDHTAAPPFTYSDTAGSSVTLSSLHGKYVYIDVWATWCGPCREELPHLKEIETAYRDKNIQFLSISVDEPGDRKKWMAFVGQHHLEGIQLLADSAFESAFIRKMGIHAIPRFILIDPGGRIVSADALRPSDAGLKKVLDELR